MKKILLSVVVMVVLMGCGIGEYRSDNRKDYHATEVISETQVIEHRLLTGEYGDIYHSTEINNEIKEDTVVYYLYEDIDGKLKSDNDLIVVEFLMNGMAFATIDGKSVGFKE